MKAWLLVCSISTLINLAPAQAQEIAGIKPISSGLDFDYVSAVGKKLQKVWKSSTQEGYTLSAVPEKYADLLREPGVTAPKSFTIVLLKVNASGDLVFRKLVRSSGNPKFDAAGMKAVLDAAPFAPLPKGTPDIAEFEMTFEPAPEQLLNGKVIAPTN